MVENQAVESGGVATTKTTKFHGMSEEPPGEPPLSGKERLSPVKIPQAASPGRALTSALTSIVAPPQDSTDVEDRQFERASFPRTLQGRVVSIDIFCSKARTIQRAGVIRVEVGVVLCFSM